MQISIALTTYNGAQFLQMQLDSFRTQARLPDELVVCDDGSTDETIEILERFKRDVQFSVRIYRNSKNLGHEQNFGKAIELCEGEIIFLSDQDDVWFPEKIATVEKLFASRPEILVVINDLEITDASLQRTGHTVIGQTRASGTLGENSKSFIIGCGSAFRSRLRTLILPIPALAYGHDKWLHDVAHVIGSRHVLEQSLQLYRRHGSNASTWAFDGTKCATWQDMVKPTVGMDLRPAYQKHRKALNLIESRLITLGSETYAELGAPRSFFEVLSDLKKTQCALTRRITLLESGFLKRKIIAIGMWLRGDYRNFLGWRSFAKDLLR